MRTLEFLSTRALVSQRIWPANCTFATEPLLLLSQIKNIDHEWVYRGQSTGSPAGGTGIWRGTWEPRPQEGIFLFHQADLILAHPPSWSLGSRTGGRAEPSRQWPGAGRDRLTSWRCEQGAWKMRVHSSKVWVDTPVELFKSLLWGIGKEQTEYRLSVW